METKPKDTVNSILPRIFISKLTIVKMFPGKEPIEEIINLDKEIEMEITNGNASMYFYGEQFSGDYK